MIQASAGRDAAVDAHQPLVNLFEFQFSDVTRRYCTWGNNLTFSGNTYTGTGAWDQIAPLTFDTTGEMSIAFTGADGTILDAVSNKSRGRVAFWRLGVIDGAYGGTSILGAYTLMAMRMSPGTIISAPGELTVMLKLMPLTDADRVHAIRTRSHADQRSIDSGDDSCRDAGLLLVLDRSNFIQKSGLGG